MRIETRKIQRLSSARQQFYIRVWSVGRRCGKGRTAAGLLGLL